MNTSQYLSEEELIERAVKALMTALGTVETMRFLALPSQPSLDAVAQHHQWQASLEKELFFKQVFSPGPP